MGLINQTGGGGVNILESERQGRWKGQVSHTATPKSLTSLCQGSCYFVLGGVDVAGCPSALSAQSWQSLHQHLKEERRAPCLTFCCSCWKDTVFTLFRLWMIVCVSCVFHSYSQQSGQWYGCSPPPWHRRGVSPPGLASSEPSVLASLKERSR